jgi:hypothetical protein
VNDAPYRFLLYEILLIGLEKRSNYSHQGCGAGHIVFLVLGVMIGEGY